MFYRICRRASCPRRHGSRGSFGGLAAFLCAVAIEPSVVWGASPSSAQEPQNSEPVEALAPPAEAPKLPALSEALSLAMNAVMDILDDPVASCHSVAAEAHLAALRESRTVETALLVGECLERRGDWVGALAAYEEAASGSLRALTEGTVMHATERLERLLPKLAGLTVPPGVPEDVEISIRASEPRGFCPAPEGCRLVPASGVFPMNPGRYSVVAKDLRSGASEGVVLETLRVGSGETAGFPMLALLGALDRWARCAELGSLGGESALDLEAQCWARQGRYARAAKQWRVFLQGTLARPKDAGTGERRSRALRRLASLPVLHVEGQLFESTRVHVRGRALADSEPSCLTSACELRVPSDTVLNEGDYTLTMKGAGGKLYRSVDFVVSRDGPAPRVQLEEPKSKWWLGSALGTAGVGVGFWIWAVQRSMGCGGDCEQAGEGRALVGDLFMGAAVVPLAWWLWPESSADASEGVHLAPAIGRAHYGLTAGFDF